MPRNLQILVDDTKTYRRCGECNLCCSTHGIKEIAKPRAVRCGSLNVTGRCGCYSTRPESCREFRCLWLQGHLSDDMKPSKSRAVFDMNDSGDILIMHVLPHDKGKIGRGILRDFIRRVSPQVPIIVVCGDDRTIYGARDEDIKLIEHNVQADGEVVIAERTYTKGEA